MTRRERYSEKGYRVLGARVKVSHPKLGIKEVELSDDPKQPFQIAVRSMSLENAKKAIHRKLRFERNSKVKLVIPSKDSGTEGFDIQTTSKLIDFLIKWDKGYDERLEKFIEDLIQKSANTFNSGANHEPTACLKAILNIHSLVEDEFNYSPLHDKQLIIVLIIWRFAH